MELKISKILSMLSLLLVLGVSSSIPNIESVAECLSENSASNILYTPTNTSYSTLLQFPIQNLRFSTPTTPKPLAIITPLIYSHVQVAVICCRQYSLKIITRSGGHSYEGLSSTSNSPFIILDLVNIRSISVDIENSTAWVQAGATIGQLYYMIAIKSPVRGFPAGICPTVGVGGHISGGGFGTMPRKYSLAADHVIDAHIVDAKGQILDRESMGEDLFWAIRGGGGASFGVILDWKIKLVDVPRIVTVFNFAKTLNEGGTKLVHKWQMISDKLDENLFIRLIIEVVGEGRSRTIRVTFNSLFLGKVDQLMQVMDSNFQELGLSKNDCTEMSWIESVLYFSGYPGGTTLDALKDRVPQPKSFFKGTTDYVQEPIPEHGLEELWKWCLEGGNPIVIMDMYGGKLNEKMESEIPFPHRGDLYSIQYLAQWDDEETGESRMNWIRKVYENMTPYVSKNPRGAYLNYGDLDFGTSNEYVEAAMTWGSKYFKGNFRRLAMVKGKVDPSNFFRFEQSIPPLIFQESTDW